MSVVKWIKITTSMFEDEKIDYIESLPEADTIIIIWVKLLTLAGKCNASGYIYLTEKIPYTAEMLAHKFRRPLNTVKLALNVFSQLGMVEILEDDTLYITNWEKYQSLDRLEQMKEQNRLRKQKQREKQKQLEQQSDTDCDSHVTGHKEVAPCHAADIDIELDKDLDKEREKEKDIKMIMSADEAAFITILENIENYPIDRKKDIEMFHVLEQRYPTLDLMETIKDWAIYKKDKPLGKKSSPRNQINGFFKKAVEWGKNQKISQKGGPKDGGHRQDYQSYDPYADLPSL